MRSHARLAKTAGTQHGLVTAGQLLALGFSRAAVARMANAGRLHRLHRGVYLLGNPVPTQHARCLAAVLATGSGALLSHGAAAWLWGLESTWPGAIDVTIPTRGHRRSGIDVHHSPSAAEEGRARFEGVPVTPVPRTLLDLSSAIHPRRLERVVDRAERRGLLDLIEIDAMLARRHGAPGSRKLREALELYHAPVFNRARSERLFLALIERAGLPRPALNLFVAGYEVDAFWERERFAVEVDGWETHRTRRAFEVDRIRQEELKLAGIDSLRVAARRIERDPGAVASSLRRLLARRRQELGLRP